MKLWLWRLSIVLFVAISAGGMYLLVPPVRSSTTAAPLPTTIMPTIMHDHASISSITPQTTITSVPIASNQTMRWAGTGETESDAVQLPAGLYRFRIHHDSNTPFAVFLLNDANDHLAMLANASTALNGDQLYGITKNAHYHVHVIAEDAWRVNVEPLMPNQPHTWSNQHGSGMSVIGGFMLDAGDQTFTWNHAGNLGFTAVLWSADGQTRLEVAQAPSSVHAGTTTISIPKTGTYWLMVQADGAWQLD